MRDHDRVLTRRGVLGFTVLLVGCGAQTPQTPGEPTTLATAIANGQLVDRAFIKAMPIIAVSYPALFTNAGVTLANVTNGTTGWLDIAGQILDLAAKPTSIPSPSMLVLAMGYLDKAMAIVVPITVAVDPALGPVIAGISVLLAVMEQALTPPQAGVTQPAAARARALAPRVTPDIARARLQAFLAS